MSNKILFVFTLAFLPFLLPAQDICMGNLGENIFEDGDFGSGTSNILFNDPGIAPGYIYTTSPPPNDGLYTITNSTQIWSSIFPTWLGITDNSDDPNGYMMVVNASHAPGAFYEETIEGLCEGTLYEFSADIINLIQAGVSGHIQPNVSFLLNDVVEYTTGNIPQNNNWNTYGFVFATLPGQTSIKLTLQNNAPGGIGNDLALDNISFRACGPEALILPTEIENICEDGEPITLTATIVGDQYMNPAYQWQQSFDEGMTWQDIPGAIGSTIMHTDLTAGYYYYRYLLANSSSNLDNSKCRVNSNVKIVFVQPKFYAVTDTICEGASYNIGTSEYLESGIYVDSLISSIGCDSIVTLNLEVVQDLGIEGAFTPVAPLCPGYEDGFITLNNVFNTYEPYVATLGTQATTAPPYNFSNLTEGPHSINITDYFGCSTDTIIMVPPPGTLTLELGPDHTVNLGEGVQLPMVTNLMPTFISWQPEEGVICEPNCLAPFLLPGQTTTYTLTIGTDAGCAISDSLTITVNEVREVYIPTAFSPNGDGRNDYFTIYANTPNVQEIISLQVFNRWGALVYEQQSFPPNDLASGWDGNFKGSPMGSDVFAYVAEVRFLDGHSIFYTGDLHLIR